MATLYELYNKRTTYKTLRENVSNAISVLSNNNALDERLSSADYIISNNYIVNDSACKGNILSVVKENLDSELGSLQTCLSSINSAIYKLNKEIEEKEAEEAAG